MTNIRESWEGRVYRLLREPTVHFFILGALLFLAHRLVVGDQRVIVVSAGLKADLQRAFLDQTGRRPTPEEMGATLRAWQRDEALYREALRERLDRDDPAVRMVLADKLRARALREFPRREPTESELEAWLAEHHGLYEIPVKYDFECVSFAKTEATARERRADYERALSTGKSPAVLGRSVLSGNLTREQLEEKFGVSLADGIRGLPPGTWSPLETQDALLVVRLNRTEGGLPSREVLRDRLLADWSHAAERQAVERAVEAIVARYRFEDKP